LTDPVPWETKRTIVLTLVERIEVRRLEDGEVDVHFVWNLPEENIAPVATRTGTHAEDNRGERGKLRGSWRRGWKGQRWR
jgi:hypothetical protein